MMRILVRNDNAGMAANVGGSVLTTYRTFDVSIPELEIYLKACDADTYSQVQVVGVELLREAGQP